MQKTAADLARVEGMQRLAQFEEHEVGHVDDVVDRFEADGHQFLLEPFGGRSDLDPADRDADVAGRGRSIQHLERNRIAGSGGKGRYVGKVEGSRHVVDLHPGIEVARHTDVGRSVDPVGGDFVFDDGLRLQVEVFFRGRADNRVFGQHHDTGMVGTDAELILRADHAEGLNAADLGLLDLEIARKDRSDAGEKDFLSGRDIGSAADDRQGLSGAVIDGGDVEMVRIRVRLAGQHLRDDDAGQPAGNLFLFGDAVHLDTDVRHRVGHLRRRE